MLVGVGSSNVHDELVEGADVLIKPLKLTQGVGSHEKEEEGASFGLLQAPLELLELDQGLDANLLVDEASSSLAELFKQILVLATNKNG